MKNIQFVVVLVIIVLNCFSNAVSQNILTGLDNYYLFKINPNVGSNTNGFTIHDAYFEILERSHCKNVVFVFPERGFQKSSVEKYFNEILKIPFSSQVSDLVIIDQVVYEGFSKSELTEIVYVRKNEVWFQEILKFTDISKFSTFPVDVLDFSAFSSYQKIRLDTNYLHSKIDKYYSLNGKLYQLSDVNNRFSEIDAESGNIIKTLDLSGLEAVVLYEMHCKPSKKDLTLAKQNRDWFKEHNRQSVMINSCTYSKSDSSLYFSITIQVFEYLKKSFDVPGKDGKVVSYPKNSPIAEAYSLILKTDTELKIISVFGIENPPARISKYVFPLTSEDIILHNDTLYVFNEPEDLEVYDKSKKAINAISCYALVGTNFKFLCTLKPEVPNSIAKYSHVALKNLHYLKGNSLYVIQDSKFCFSKVSETHQKETCIEIDLSYESVPENIEDRSSLSMNFRNLCCTYQNQHELLLLAYESNKQVRLDVFDKNLTRLQTSNLALKADWFYYRSVFHQDNWIIPSIESDGVYLIKIPLTYLNR